MKLIIFSLLSLFSQVVLAGLDNCFISGNNIVFCKNEQVYLFDEQTNKLRIARVLDIDKEATTLDVITKADGKTLKNLSLRDVFAPIACIGLFCSGDLRWIKITIKIKEDSEYNELVGMLMGVNYGNNTIAFNVKKGKIEVLSLDNLVKIEYAEK
jgi:hypothetical protein